MRVLVIGASGFLGGFLLAALRHRHDVVGTSRDGSTAGTIALDVRDAAAARSVLARRWDLVVHAAGVIDAKACERDPAHAYQVNVAGTRLIARFARARVVFFSTDYVFDGGREQYDEDDEPRPLNVYGSTKLAAERVLLSHDSAHVIVRLPFLYGTSPTRDAFLARFAARQVTVPHPAHCNPVYLPDITDALVPLSEQGGIIHFGGATETTRLGFYQLAAGILGMRVGFNPVPADHMPDGVVRPRASVLLSRRTTMRGRSIEAGLGDLARHLATSRS